MYLWIRMKRARGFLPAIIPSIFFGLFDKCLVSFGRRPIVEEDAKVKQRVSDTLAESTTVLTIMLLIARTGQQVPISVRQNPATAISIVGFC
ncbi:hypothetical protein C449_14322 [Halococcus saccharolyticus DSM 5350]|uniref:Uncharacterized protein n=1 Tax=Halococcus saccharolyticus DSM 5350 TaxID=1227455 RepID=M0MBN5_9EURY|nr:hypothetical protein C449_14322 [Halococcus saccharolyticus DSM 5350]